MLSAHTECSLHAILQRRKPSLGEVNSPSKWQNRDSSLTPKSMLITTVHTASRPKAPTSHPAVNKVGVTQKTPVALEGPRVLGAICSTIFLETLWRRA